MTTLAAILYAGLALAYLLRMDLLRFKLHEPSFVAQNILSGIACLYSAYSIVESGWSPLAVIAPAMAGLYWIRSKEAFKSATSPDVPRRRHTDFAELSEIDWQHISGGKG